MVQPSNRNDCEILACFASSCLAMTGPSALALSFGSILSTPEQAFSARSGKITVESVNAIADRTRGTFMFVKPQVAIDFRIRTILAGSGRITAYAEVTKDYRRSFGFASG